MELTNSFDVAAPPDVVWRTVGDMPQVALCLPGAVIVSQDGDTYHGRVTIKVGPISMGLGGTATVVARDDDERRLEVLISAEDVTGQGTVEATLVVTADPSPAGTTVSIATTMQLGGKVAQFGSGLLTQVSGRIVKQVAKRMGALVESGAASAGHGPTDAAGVAAGVGPAVPRTRRTVLVEPARLAQLAAVAVAAAVFGWSLGRSLEPAAR
ncbi:SRPBCC family protein [Georgenia daeguensis]|uniref:SRPBCC family protein n=1 Tax=Georgenia daeguensis TaxID=908355 RepID=A0ABP8ETQ3_9MICO